MLTHLFIKDFTLIDKLDIDFHPGFSVITGETGAGKSIIIGAIQLLIGQRADAKLVKAGRQKCIVEAHFDISNYDLKSFFDDNDIDYDPTDCVLRREVNASGKSRAFINDTPQPLTAMKALGEKLMDIHSQHQNLLLQKEDFQLNVIDIVAHDEAEKKQYEEAFTVYRRSAQQLQEFREQLKRNQDNIDFVTFQYNELDSAKLVVGEQEELEARAKILEHAEEIKSALYEASQSLGNEENGSVTQTRNAESSLEGIADVFPEMKETADRLSTAYIELKDILDDVERKLESVDFDPNEMQTIDDRLDTIYSLEQKNHVDTVEQLIGIRDRLKSQLDEAENGDEKLKELVEKEAKAKKECEMLAAKLTKARHKGAKKTEEAMKNRLPDLGIPKVRFEISFEQKELSPSGADKVAFLFSANTGTPLQPISQVASGGEIARVMLALKAMISKEVKLPTIIFDEIDTGVSGRVAERMARIMREMGDNHRQVISITHLPQIAALGVTHYKVSKAETPEGTVSQMVMLTPEERVREIAQMLSGSNVSEAAMDNARDLLNMAHNTETK